MLLYLLAVIALSLLIFKFLAEPLLRTHVTETQLLLGERRPNDQPLGQHLVQVDGCFLRCVSESPKLSFPRGTVITTLHAVDLFGATVRVVNGGVGRHHVTLELRSRFCLGIKCAVAVYGVPEGPGPRARISGWFSRTFKKISDRTDSKHRVVDNKDSGEIVPVNAEDMKVS